MAQNYGQQNFMAVSSASPPVNKNSNQFSFQPPANQQHQFKAVPPVNPQYAYGDDNNHEHGGSQSQRTDQYDYYYEGHVTDITPNPNMVQHRPEMKLNDMDTQLSSPWQIEESLINERPKCPYLLYNDGPDSTFSMPTKSITISSELHISTAFTRITITFMNTSTETRNGLFVLPCKGTVTSCQVNINNSRYLDTTFVDNDSAKEFESKKKSSNNQEDDTKRFIPDLFRLPIPDIAPNEMVTVEVDYMESLQFIQSRYHYHVAMNFGNGAAPPVVNIDCTINCLTPGIRYGSTTNQLMLTEQANLKCIKLYTNNAMKMVPNQQNMNNNSNNDFHLFYSVQTNLISAALITDERENAFTCFLNPPAMNDGVFCRDIIFLLDRSGSMTGKPYQDAVNGMTFALKSLTNYDRFGIVAFDHEQLHFDDKSEAFDDNNVFSNKRAPEQLFDVNPESISHAIQFLQNTKARGTTDIETPLMSATKFLNKQHKKAKNNNNRIPFVILLTDGAVINEKEIVRKVMDIEDNQTRILTFGIGKFCNYYFLKMLSLKTRGWDNGSIYATDLYPKIKAMMDRAKQPILTNLSLSIEKQKGCEMYPSTIPDLFCGGPIIVSGKCKQLNNEMTTELKGILSNGQPMMISISADNSNTSKVPVSRVFLKQRIDQLTAEYWLTENEKIKKEIIDLSIQQRFPSPYTSMVSYELTPKEYEEQKQNDNNDNQSVSKGKGKGLSSAQIAGLAGGAVVIGTAAILIGSVAATMGGISVLDSNLIGGLGNMFGQIGDIDIGDCPCDACFGAISCGNLDCGSLANGISCGGCVNCNEILDALPFGDCPGGCGALPGCGAIGGICDSCGGFIEVGFDAMGGCCDVVPELCGDCFGNIAGMCSNIGDLCGVLQDCFGNFGECCGEVFNIFNEVV